MKLKDYEGSTSLEYQPVELSPGITDYVPASYQTTKLKATWTAEQAKDLYDFHGLDDLLQKANMTQPIVTDLKVDVSPMGVANITVQLEEKYYGQKATNATIAGLKEDLHDYLKQSYIPSTHYLHTKDYNDLVNQLYKNQTYGTGTYAPTTEEDDLKISGNDEDDMDPILFSAKSNNWNTPDIIFEWLKPMGEIALDPCANASSHVPAIVSYIHPNCNGLAESWNVTNEHTQGYVFVNPPYSKDKLNPSGIKAWVDKAVDEWNQNAVESILLVPARTDTKWFQGLMQVAGACCFIKGRVGFEQVAPYFGEPSTVAKAPFPSALIYLGKRNMLFCQTLDSRGWCISQ